MAGIPSTEIRQEAEKKSRELSGVEQRILTLLRATPKDENTGQRAWTEAAHRERMAAEATAAKLTREIGALQDDYREALAEENLARMAAENFTPRPMVPPDPTGGGQAGGLLLPAGAGGTKAMRADSIAAAFMESRAYKAWNHGHPGQHASFELEGMTWRDVFMRAAMKATLDSTGFTGYERPPGTVLLGQQQLTVADLCGQATTTQPSVRIMQEVSFTNAAAAVAEGGLKPEATWVLNEVDTPVRKIGVTSKVTDEAYSDFGQLRDYLDNRLPFSVRQREEFLVLTGDGIAPNPRGIMNTPGILSVARGGTENNIDAIYRAITQVRTVGFYAPDGVVIDPSNWTPIRLAKTAAGQYIYGDPWVPGPETIFGKRVIVTVNQTDNTALVGQFRMGCTLYYRQAVTVDSTNSNEDDFKYNRIALRAEERLAVGVHRPAAFCTATGLSNVIP